MLTDFADNGGQYQVTDLVDFNGKLIFEFYDENINSSTLYESDGTAVGTVSVFAAPSTVVSDPTVVGDSLYFFAISSTSNSALWVMNGSGARPGARVLPDRFERRRSRIRRGNALLHGFQCRLVD